MTRLRQWLRSVEWLDVALLAMAAVLLIGGPLCSCVRGG